MSEQSKEWVGAALLGDLLVELGRREAIRRLLGEIGEGASPELVKSLAEEFERILEGRRRKLLAGAPAALQGGTPKGASFEIHLKPPDSVLRPPAGPRPAAEKKIPPEPKAAPRPAMAEKATAPPAKEPRSEPPDVQPARVSTPPILEAPVSGAAQGADEHAMAVSGPAARTPYDQPLDGPLYVHAVAFVPAEEEPSKFPFMLEAKGIEGKAFVFGLDHGRFRFYLSKLNSELARVSKNGMLLLNKSDSIRLHGVHESTLNDLRTQGILLPFEFGTVVSGKEDLAEKAGAHAGELEQALDELVRTVWWNLEVFAMDSRMAQLVGTENPAARREQERGRVSFSAPAQSRRIDIKTLERILSKQKKIAESIHQSLSAVATRSDVDMMIDLDGGSSEDWKPILRASYEIPDNRVSTFNREIADLQYQHFLFELMLAVRGDREEFQFH